MAEIRHLNNAPVIEAILGFQADVSGNWVPERIREQLPERFPEFTQIQEQRRIESPVSVAPGREPEATTRLSPVDRFLVHRDDRTEAIQVKRDGFAFSQLQPYPGWDSFAEQALQQWAVFQDWMEVEEPFKLFTRFINRVRYPQGGFQLKTYFISPPESPPSTHWKFSHFREHHVYEPEDPGLQIESIFSSGGPVPGEESLEFSLDLIISPLRSLAESGESVDSLLPRLRDLKNRAFFAKFSEDGIAPYA
jgi:uncharacterized protein (TIGR04255 family)